MEIKFYNRKKRCIESEKVLGENLISWLYQTRWGKVAGKVLSKAPFSKLYGLYQSTRWSKISIWGFIEEYKINMNDFVPENNRISSDPYSSFNKFFIRKLKDGARTFASGNSLPAFAEARYLGFKKIADEHRFPVKGEFLRVRDLLLNQKWASFFEDGPLMIARLCPVDYHRFHFPDDGEVLDEYRIHGEYHSVNPIALNAKNDVFVKNERHVTIINTKTFGHLALIEVGAMCVGKIIQTYKGKTFKRGEEKGYFLFGGSTVIIVGEAHKWLPSDDILQNTIGGMETYIELGEEVGRSLK